MRDDRLGAPRHPIATAVARIALAIVVSIAAFAVSFRFFDAAWARHWGATARESAATLPGDGLVRNAISQTTRAVTVDAPATAVWPWLVQIGAGRGGLYSYDLAERLTGVSIHNADRIIPAFQTIAVGDTIWITQDGHPAKLVFKVAIVEPNRALVLAFTKRPHDEVVPSDPGWSWSFTLRPIDAHTTRLILRSREATQGNPFADAMQQSIVGPIGFVMERKMLLGIEQRAEAAAASHSEPWLFSLLLAGAAGTLWLGATRRLRRPWRLAAAGLSATALTQVVIRGFPNVGYALIVDAAIAGAVVFIYGHRSAPEPILHPATAEVERELQHVRPA